MADDAGRPGQQSDRNHDRLASLLADLDDGAALPALADDDAGLAKLAVVTRTLRSRPAWAQARYRPLRATGGQAAHALAFARGDDAIAVATRLPIGLDRAGGWGNTALPLAAGSWHDELTGSSYEGGIAIGLTDLLARLPVALLTRG
jgi:(1->4)-alpha-D-glucan 1-alpha-D-glucosylmutase